mmetsp:Transcript_23684/g.35131  ORF Transcript_23684/g.35131 Transcript_23684/m.35131 type:complete len:100 (+) Transcript_23684:455-754(+)
MVIFGRIGRVRVVHTAHHCHDFASRVSNNENFWEEPWEESHVIRQFMIPPNAINNDVTTDDVVDRCIVVEVGDTARPSYDESDFFLRATAEFVCDERVR